ncbi:MAG: long-chain fatty acid--CoA ligase [Myxococcales bacterium]|nr:long-chain fatty acid--CoA ligase [Myxococcales bacterium]
MTWDPRFTDLVTLWEESADAFADRPALGSRQAGGWAWHSYGELADRVRRVAGALACRGVGRGDRVAVVSRNRVEWFVACHATLACGAVWVPMYETQRAEDWTHILDDSGARTCFVANDTLEGRIRTLRPGLGVVAFDGTFSAFLEADPLRGHDPPAADDLAVIIYTSGTTGEPKGVELTHRSIGAEVSAMAAALPLRAGERTLATLPWAHVGGGCIEVNLALVQGAGVAVCDDVSALPECLDEVQPHFVAAVPRVWARLRDLIRQSPNRDEAMALLGGRLRFAASGAASLSPDVVAALGELGVPLLDTYGMTEVGGVATVVPLDAVRAGSVGKALPGFRIEIDAPDADGEGEIVIHSAGRMRGYRGLPALTRETVRADGGVRSGDLGRLDADGHLHVTGRIKELYKLDNGRYVSPAPLEDALASSPYVSQAFIHGAGQARNVALLVPDARALRDWAGCRGEEGAGLADLVNRPSVRELLRVEIERCSSSWRGYERIAQFTIVTEPFSVEAGLVTPTLKPKRAAIERRFAREISELHQRG